MCYDRVCGGKRPRAVTLFDPYGQEPATIREKVTTSLFVQEKTFHGF